MSNSYTIVGIEGNGEAVNITTIARFVADVWKGYFNPPVTLRLRVEREGKERVLELIPTNFARGLKNALLIGQEPPLVRYRVWESEGQLFLRQV